jgi:hypothetical protein
MNLFFDVSIAIPIGILYNLMILKFGDIVNENITYKLKIQRNLLLGFIGATFAFLLANFIFGDNKQYKNRAIQYGLWLGSCILLIHVVLYNWNILENDSKLIIIIITFIVLLLYSYGFHTANKEKIEEIEDIEEFEEF